MSTPAELVYVLLLLGEREFLHVARSNRIDRGGENVDVAMYIPSALRGAGRNTKKKCT